MIYFDNDFGEMIINKTDNVHFTQKLDSHLEKHSIEYQALAILKLAFGDYANGFVRLDSPDLQNHTTKTGIEVVTSFPEKYHEIIRNAYKHGNSQLVFPVNEGVETNTFINTIIDKSKKIGSYKANGFAKIGLFVWHLSPVATDCYYNIEKAWEELLKDAKCFMKDNFDFLLVIVEHSILYFDSFYSLKESKTIPIEYFKRLSTLGRMAAEGLFSDNDSFWK